MFGSNHRDYDLKAELSHCCNLLGTVFLAQHLPSGTYLCVKKYQLDKIKDEFSEIINEISSMRQLNHANILPIHTSFVNNLEVLIVTPLMCYGSCKDAITSYFSTGFPELIVAFILRDVLYGLEYLHRRGFIHRSIRASHILLNQYKAVLSGFRKCTNTISHGRKIRILHDLPPNSQCELTWLAPEILEQNLLGYTEKSDIYSIGIVSCELANGLEPFSGLPTTFMLTEKLRGNQPTLLDYSTCPSDEVVAEAVESGVGDNFAIQARQIYSNRKFSEDFHKLTENCLQRLPSSRFSPNQMLHHSFFKQCKNSSLAEQLRLNGLVAVDCSSIQDNPTSSIEASLSELELNNRFEWDF